MKGSSLLLVIILSILLESIVELMFSDITEYIN